MFEQLIKQYVELDLENLNKQIEACDTLAAVKTALRLVRTLLFQPDCPMDEHAYAQCLGVAHDLVVLFERIERLYVPDENAVELNAAFQKLNQRLNEIDAERRNLIRQAEQFRAESVRKELEEAPGDLQ